jgi:Glycosyl transferases group 1
MFDRQSGREVVRMPTAAQRNVLLWNVHGWWTESFVQGRHCYLLPANAVEAAQLADTAIDVVVLQRPEELELTAAWTGRRPGVDVAAVYVEHNAPGSSPTDCRHPLANRRDIPIVHVTEFNRLMWDNGAAPTTVIAYGINDPGALYSGDLPAAATMINEPIQRARVVGTDLLDQLAAHVPVDVWGIGTRELTHDDVRGWGAVLRPTLHQLMARRRVYLHTARWTSLDISLIEAMQLAMPVVAVASTMAPLIVPSQAGVVSADVDTLAEALRYYVSDPEAARAAGKWAREFALQHFGLDRFLQEWDELIGAVCA